MRRGSAGAVVIFTLAAAPAAAGQTSSVTFATDVAPIVFAKCAGCHRDGGDAPFPLISFEDVRRRAKTIRAVTVSRYMPPWKPVPGFGDFHGERRLSDAELSTITRWIDGGMLAGDDRQHPAAPPPEQEWPLGTPDVVLRLPSYTLRASGADVFRNFVVPWPAGSLPYVRAWHFRPGSAAVHHANIRIDRTPASRALDEKDPSPGYEGVVLRSADFPDGHFLGWTPGQAPQRLLDEAAWRVDPGSDFVVQLHMRPTGRPEPVAPVIGLYLGRTPPSSPPTMIRLGRQRLNIPAGASAHSVTDSFEVPVDVRVHAVQAHAHYRARSVHAWAHLPDGSRRELLRIDDWDPAWQDRYEYQSPIALPGGARLVAQYVFDNSTANPRNPTQPPQPAEWGWRTQDEMGDVWLQVTTSSDRDRQLLRASAHRHMHTEDAVGTEALIAREPQRVDLRNDAASIYMALGQPREALRHFGEAKRLRPSAAAAFNVGVAFEATGDARSAELEYREALRLDPDYSAAHNNLGTLLLGRRQAAAAHDAFVRAVRSNPSNAEAHANLAYSHLGRDERDQAAEHVIAAIELGAPVTVRFVGYVWALAATPDESRRRPAAAVRVAEAVVNATGRQDATALDALAIAYASQGRFDEAVAAANESLALPPGDAPEGDVRARRDLYLARKPFILPPR